MAKATVKTMHPPGKPSKQPMRIVGVEAEASRKTGLKPLLTPLRPYYGWPKK